MRVQGQFIKQQLSKSQEIEKYFIKRHFIESQ